MRSSKRSRLPARTSTSSRTRPRPTSRARFVHIRPDGERVPIPKHTDYRGFALEERSVILKIHGAVDRGDETADSYVITEDHYIDYLAQDEPLQAHPGPPHGQDADEPLPLPRLRDARLEPSRHPPPHLVGADAALRLVGGPARARARSTAASGIVTASRSSTLALETWVDTMRAELG